MKIAIQRVDDKVVVIKDYTEIKDNGEIAHIICELETIKQDLLHIWRSKLD
jgi:hypothetical protein